MPLMEDPSARLPSTATNDKDAALSTPAPVPGMINHPLVGTGPSTAPPSARHGAFSRPKSTGSRNASRVTSPAGQDYTDARSPKIRSKPKSKGKKTNRNKSQPSLQHQQQLQGMPYPSPAMAPFMNPYLMPWAQQAGLSASMQNSVYPSPWGSAPGAPAQHGHENQHEDDDSEFTEASPSHHGRRADDQDASDEDEVEEVTVSPAPWGHHTTANVTDDEDTDSDDGDEPVGHHVKPVNASKTPYYYPKQQPMHTSAKLSKPRKHGGDTSSHKRVKSQHASASPSTAPSQQQQQKQQLAQMQQAYGSMFPFGFPVYPGVTTDAGTSVSQAMQQQAQNPFFPHPFAAASQLPMSGQFGFPPGLYPWPIPGVSGFPPSMYNSSMSFASGAPFYPERGGVFPQLSGAPGFYYPNPSTLQKHRQQSARGDESDDATEDEDEEAMHPARLNGKATALSSARPKASRTSSKRKQVSSGTAARHVAASTSMTSEDRLRHLSELAASFVPTVPGEQPAAKRAKKSSRTTSKPDSQAASASVMPAVSAADGSTQPVKLAKLTPIRPPREQRFYPCTFPGCTLVYKKSSHLRNHFRRHTGEKPFACQWPGCQWRFCRSDELARHMRSHRGEKPHQCDLCKRRFTRSDHLKKHLAKHLEEDMAASEQLAALSQVRALEEKGTASAQQSSDGASEGSVTPAPTSVPAADK